MKINFIKLPIIAAFTLLGMVSCSNDDGDVSDDDSIVIDDNSETDEENPTTTELDVYAKIYGATSVTSDGTYVTIKTSGAPDHKSTYYENENDLYEAFSGTTYNDFDFFKNPNRIASFDYSFKIPLKPAEATRHAATPLGAIGVSLNGVPFFNQYAGPNEQALTDEYRSFDKYNGHPTGSGMYHYHVEPTYLTTVTASRSELLGFLLDGFPVYGPVENEADVAESELDEFHGHTHATEDYPEGIYHYHVTNTPPFINGNGYYGTPGTVTQ